MAINLTDDAPRISYTVSTSTSTFQVPFEFFDAEDLVVVVGGTTKTLTTHYTVSQNTNKTGSITMTTGNAVSSGTVIIFRNIAFKRTTDFPTSGSFDMDTLNTELDRNIALFDDQQDRIDRAVRLNDNDDAASMVLPLKASRKGTVLGFNATTGAAEAGPTIANVNSLADITTNINTVAGIASNVTTVAGIDANVSTVAGISSSVSTVAGIQSNVSSVAGNATNINTVAGSIASVNTVASNIADVNAVAADLAETVSEIETVAADLQETQSEIDTVAANIANVNTVGTDITNVNTVAGSMGNVSSVAGQISNVNQVANNLASVTTVAGISANVNTVAADGTDIGTVATNIANVNTVGGISGNVTTVAGISSNVSTVAGISSNVSTVAGIDTDVSTVAGISSNVTSVANDASDIGTVASAITNVNTVAGNTTNINTVAGNNSNISAVGGISSNVTTVAGIASNVTTVAGISSDVTTVANDATDIGTVSTNISNVNTLANALSGTNAYTVTVVNSGGNKFALNGATNPALTLKRGITYTFDQSDNSNSGHPLAFKDGSGNAYTSGVTVTGSAGQAGAKVVFAVPSNAPSSLLYYCTQHGNAMGNSITVQDDNVAIVAGISSNITTVAGVASDVTTVAGISAAVSAVNSNATNINAVNSNSSNINAVANNSSNINTVASNNSNITTVATNVSGINDFADRYRVASSAPSSNNDEGDLYYNTTSDQLFVYNGSAWISAALDAASALVPSNNLSDLQSASTARTNLGLGDAATKTVGISNGNVATFTSGVADNDFLKIDGTTVEGRSAAEMRSDLNVEDGATANSAGNAITISSGVISHSDTSSQASSNNSGRTYIQDITLDTYGHVTGIATATETVTDTNTTYSGGTNISLSGTTFNLDNNITLSGTAQATRYYIDGTSKYIDSAGGNYGTIKVEGATGGWEGYAIGNDFVFMGAGSQCGIYNDIHNQWFIKNFPNSYTSLHQAGSEVLRTDVNGIWVRATGTSNPATDATIYLGSAGYAKLYNDAGTAVYLYNNVNEIVLYGEENGKTQLYYNNNYKLRTNQDGIRVVNHSTVDGTIALGSSEHARIVNDEGTAIYMTTGANENFIYSNENSFTYLYYNGSWRLRTTNAGIQINGALATGSETGYGTSGQVLTSNGSSHPTWQDASGGGWEFVSGVRARHGSEGSITSATFNNIERNALYMMLIWDWYLDYNNTSQYTSNWVPTLQVYFDHGYGWNKNASNGTLGWYQSSRNRSYNSTTNSNSSSFNQAGAYLNASYTPTRTNTVPPLMYVVYFNNTYGSDMGNSFKYEWRYQYFGNNGYRSQDGFGNTYQGISTVDDTHVQSVRLTTKTGNNLWHGQVALYKAKIS